MYFLEHVLDVASYTLSTIFIITILALIYYNYFVDKES